MLASPPPVVETYQATVLKVIDGDTIKVIIPPWPTPFRTIDVRLSGIDTPEHELPPAKKTCEVKKGLDAIVYANSVIHVGDHVAVTWNSQVGNDKYFRLLGKITLPDGRDYGAIMVGAGKARAYDGGTKLPWC